MKKNQRLSDALGVICIIFIFAGCVEGLDGGPAAWNFISLGIAGIFGALSWLTAPKPQKKETK